MDRQKVITIVGPTASGKSALAVELAKRFGGEIISADSRQVYLGLDIGTGKITKRQMHGVPHHLLDVAPPKKRFTAHDFVVHASKAMHEISARGNVPIICGGTGFYIDALLGRIELSNVPADERLRAKLDKNPPDNCSPCCERKIRSEQKYRQTQQTPAHPSIGNIDVINKVAPLIKASP